MTHYIPGFSRSSSIGSALGEGLGYSLTSGLQLLAQERMKKLEQKNTAKALEQFGVSPQDALSLSKAPPEIQKQFLSQLELQKLLGGESGPPFEETLTEEVKTPKGIESLSDTHLVGLSGRGGGIGQVAKAELERRKQKGKESFQEKSLALKETKDFRKNINEKYRNAKDVRNRLSRLQELVESGDLSSAPAAYILERLPGDLTFLLSPDSQEFQKLSLDLTAGLARDFGNRINISEFKTFLKRVPSLLQSEEGKKRVIRNLELIQVQPNILRGKATNEIIKENGGVPPLDLEERVEERIQPDLDKISEKIKKGISTSQKSKKEQVPSSLRKGYVRVRSPEGQEGQIPKENLKEALQSGFERV